MLRLFRPDFEVVREGRIFNKIRHLQTQIVSVFYFTLVYARFWLKWDVWTEKMSREYFSPYKGIICSVY
jgi:hypothetical protein